MEIEKIVINIKNNIKKIKIILQIKIKKCISGYFAEGLN